MKQKRIWSMVLAACMLMSMILPIHAAAAPTVTLTGGEVKPGEVITLTASIQDNPGISAFQLYVYYDTSVFEADGMRVAGSFSESGSMLTNSIAVADSKGRYDGQAGKDGMLGLWLSGGGINQNEDGEMVIIRLRVKEDADAGSYTIGVDYSKKNTINEDFDKVTLKTSGATVKVLSDGSSNTTPIVPVEPSKPEETDTPVFDDVAGNWAEDYILECAERGIVVGDEGHYYPNDNMTRAEFMMILWRVMGSPAPKGKATFTDLPMAWYQEPIAWAEENAITNGTSPTTFDPNGNVTREQMMTILHRLAGKPIGMESIFTAVYDQQLADSASISSWAKDAVYWSIFQEILCGEQSVKLGNTVAPGAAATRSQIAVSILRYLDR